MTSLRTRPVKDFQKVQMMTSLLHLYPLHHLDTVRQNQARIQTKMVLPLLLQCTQMFRQVCFLQTVMCFKTFQMFDSDSAGDLSYTLWFYLLATPEVFPSVSCYCCSCQIFKGCNELFSGEWNGCLSAYENGFWAYLYISLSLFITQNLLKPKILQKL